MINGEDPRGRPAQHPRHAAGRGADTSLRLQALEIIDSLLNSTGPELEEARSGLRRHVQEHPWDPEIALLLHLWDRTQYLVTPGEVTIPPAQPPNGSHASTHVPESPTGD